MFAAMSRSVFQGLRSLVARVKAGDPVAEAEGRRILTVFAEECTALELADFLQVVTTRAGVLSRVSARQNCKERSA